MKTRSEELATEVVHTYLDRYVGDESLAEDVSLLQQEYLSRCGEEGVTPLHKIVLDYDWTSIQARIDINIVELGYN